MFSTYKTTLVVTSLFCLTLITAWSDTLSASDDVADAHATHATHATQGQDRIGLDVYKSETCGCCGNWITHLETQGIDSIVRAPEELGASGARADVPPRYRSCHTAVTKDGYVFVGHIPAKFIRQFLSELPAGAVGLSVPGMPVGSPGMEQGDTFMPYQVLLLRADGSSELFAAVNSAEEQNQ